MWSAGATTRVSPSKIRCLQKSLCLLYPFFAPFASDVLYADAESRYPRMPADFVDLAPNF